METYQEKWAARVIAGKGEKMSVIQIWQKNFEKENIEISKCKKHQGSCLASLPAPVASSSSARDG